MMLDKRCVKCDRCVDCSFIIGLVVGNHAPPRLDDLTPGQRDCLRRVLTRKSSKEIALELGISPHTVDQRLRLAIQTLGVANRFEAARLFAAREAIEPYQPPSYQAPDIVRADAAFNLASTTAVRDWAAGGEQQDGSHTTETYGAQHGQTAPRAWLPFPQARGGRHELSIVARLGWILVIAMGSAIAFGTFLTGIQALTILATGRG